MNKFKVGDLVKCVEADAVLILYGIYRVSKLNSRDMVFLAGESQASGWCPRRFELVEEPPKTTPHATPVAHVHAALIKAWADGATIQIQLPSTGTWHDNPSPTWCANVKYRIKPEPKPDTTQYAMLTTEGFTTPTPFCFGSDNVKATFDGETGKLKSVEMI